MSLESRVDCGWSKEGAPRGGATTGVGCGSSPTPRRCRLVRETAARGVELLAEQWVPIEREVAVLVARRPSGEARVYPVVETVQRDGICHELLAPAPSLRRPGRRGPADLGLAVAGACGVTSILALEHSSPRRPAGQRGVAAGLQLGTSSGGVLFQNHLRAILDWPLGDRAHSRRRWPRSTSWASHSIRSSISPGHRRAGRPSTSTTSGPARAQAGARHGPGDDLELRPGKARSWPAERILGPGTGQPPPREDLGLPPEGEEVETHGRGGGGRGHGQRLGPQDDAPRGRGLAEFGVPLRCGSSPPTAPRRPCWSTGARLKPGAG